MNNMAPIITLKCHCYFRCSDTEKTDPKYKDLPYLPEISQKLHCNTYIYQFNYLFWVISLLNKKIVQLSLFYSKEWIYLESW